MCGTCGCNQPDGPFKLALPGEQENKEHHHDHDHHHAHDHSHHHHDEHGHHHEHESKVIDLETDILNQNNLLAQRNRGFFEAKNIMTINLVSSPGSGKTSLLERTITDLKGELPIYVIEGDQQTLNDANRIEAAGAPVIQVNTGTGCHLDAQMIHQAVKQLNVPEAALLMIENVGNLVCPSLFDLGEGHRVVIMSTTEGADKPLKYPNMFASSDACVINKIDLLPYVDFDMEKAREYALRINPKLIFFEVSATKGDGLESWYSWLKNTQTEPLADPYLEKV